MTAEAFGNGLWKESYMWSLRDVLQQADKNRVAIGHFNISDSVQLKAVVTAAQELKVPVLIGVSEG